MLDAEPCGFAGGKICELRLRHADDVVVDVDRQRLVPSGVTGVRTITVELGELLRETLALTASDAQARQVTISLQIPAKLPAVLGDRVQLQQVLLNLIRNSAQAMESNPRERPPRIVLGLSREPAYAVVEVSDNGPGMEEAVLRRVFEPFFTTKAPGVGTGLGLSVSYAIVTQNHKGMIAVDSTPGHGARFIVKLPLY